MGFFSDLRRLMRAAKQLDEPDGFEAEYEESLRQAASFTQMWTNASQPLGTHGAATANPYTNFAFLRSAIPASGTVMHLAPTQDRLGQATIYEVGLEMHIDGREPYGTIYRTVIGAAALPNWQPGKMLTFRVSPDDPHTIMLG